MRAASLLRGRRTAVLTGAGISTDSGIPAYRGAGTTPRTPMTLQQFQASEEAQRRYWVGSHLGWRAFSGAGPNAGHAALANLERAGLVHGVITQNVDGLHRAAGSRHVIELHGTMARVLCLRCGQVFDRHDVGERIERDNSWITHPEHIELRPDGDVEARITADFVLPTCSLCEGPLKPDVVFFGQFVPPPLFRAAEALVAGADALLVAGTSLVVNSGIRIVERARRRRLPLIVINHEPTKADADADVILRCGTSQALGELALTLAEAG